MARVKLPHLGLYKYKCIQKCKCIHALQLETIRSRRRQEKIVELEAFREKKKRTAAKAQNTRPCNTALLKDLATIMVA